MVRKQKNFEEKIIDDFAICAFKTWDDLQAASVSSIPSEDETTKDETPHKVKRKKQLSPPCSSSKKKLDENVDVDIKEKHKTTTIEDAPQKTKSKKKILSPPCSPNRKKSQKDVDLKAEKQKTSKDLNDILRKAKTSNKISSKDKLKTKREHKHIKSKTIKSHQPKRKKPKKEPSSTSSRSETASNDSCTNEEINDGESKSDDHELQVSSTISTGSISSSTVVTIKTSTTTKSCKVSNHTSSTSRSSISILNQPLSEAASQPPTSTEPKCSSTSSTTSTSATTATTTTSATTIIDSNVSSSKVRSPPLPSPPTVLDDTIQPQHSSPVVSSKSSIRPCCPINPRPQSPINSNMVTITNESSTVMKTTKVTGRSASTSAGSTVTKLPTNTATLTASQSMTSKAMTTKLQSSPMQSHINSYREDETVAKRQIPGTSIGNNFNQQPYPVMPPSFSGHASTAHTTLTSTSNKTHQEFFRLEELRSRKDSHLPMQDSRIYNHNNSMQHTRPPMAPLQSFGSSCISTHTPPLTVPNSLLHFSPNSSVSSNSSRIKPQNNPIHQISPIRNEPARSVTSGNIHHPSQLNGYPSIPVNANGSSYHSPIMSEYSQSTRVEHNPSLATQVKRELGERFLATHQMEKIAAAAASANLSSYGPKPMMYPSLQTHMQHANTTMHPCYQQHQSSLMNNAYSGQPSICITDTISRHSTTSIIPGPPAGAMSLSGSMISQTATSRFGAISNLGVDMGMHSLAQPLPSPYNQHHNMYPPNMAQRELANHLGGYPFSSTHLLPQLGRLGTSDAPPSMVDPYALEFARYKAATVDQSILYNRAFPNLPQFNPTGLNDPIQSSPYAAPRNLNAFRPPTYPLAGVYQPPYI